VASIKRGSGRSHARLRIAALLAGVSLSAVAAHAQDATWLLNATVPGPVPGTFDFNAPLTGARRHFQAARQELPPSISRIRPTYRSRPPPPLLEAGHSMPGRRITVSPTNPLWNSATPASSSTAAAPPSPTGSAALLVLSIPVRLAARPLSIDSEGQLSFSISPTPPMRTSSTGLAALPVLTMPVRLAAQLSSIDLGGRPSFLASATPGLRTSPTDLVALLAFSVPVQRAIQQSRTIVALAFFWVLLSDWDSSILARLGPPQLPITTMV
jgi:hypothetical protein